MCLAFVLTTVDEPESGTEKGRNSSYLLEHPLSRPFSYLMVLKSKHIWRFLRLLLRGSTFIQQPSLAVTFRCSSEDAMFHRRNRFPPKRMTQKSINPAESALHRRRRRCLVKLLPKNPLLLHNFRTTTEFGKAKCQSITIARNTSDSLAKPQPQSEIRSVIVH